MKHWLLIASLVGAPMMSLVACGSGNDGPGAPSTEMLIDMTDAELEKFCQWAFETSSGWQCSDGTAEEFTVDECKKVKPTCKATIIEAERCWTIIRGKCGAYDPKTVARECATMGDC